MGVHILLIAPENEIAYILEPLPINTGLRIISEFSSHGIIFSIVSLLILWPTLIQSRSISIRLEFFTSH